MPGPVSDSYEAPICRCGHFKRVHNWPDGDCDADDCNCKQFEKVALADTELGKALDDFARGFDE